MELGRASFDMKACNTTKMMYSMLLSLRSFSHVLDISALALVLENTALFGDILLRLPDITHQVTHFILKQSDHSTVLADQS